VSVGRLEFPLPLDKASQYIECRRLELRNSLNLFRARLDWDRGSIHTG